MVVIFLALLLLTLTLRGRSTVMDLDRFISDLIFLPPKRDISIPLRYLQVEFSPLELGFLNFVATKKSGFLKTPFAT
ncbi:MAG: hypothetical protein AAGI69_08350 [Cyanobacteria bacterium P01_H01_bin.21]